MVAIIQGSNRRGSATKVVANAVAHHLTTIGVEATIVDLEDMPGSVLHSDMYDTDAKNSFLDDAEDAFKQADSWIFIFPEYNGSFPGALKLLIDALSVRDYKALFGGKIAALIGTASGRAGNLRGIDHLTGVLHHLGTVVRPLSLPISLIDAHINDAREYAQEEARSTLTDYVDGFLEFAGQARHA